MLIGHFLPNFEIPIFGKTGGSLFREPLISKILNTDPSDKYSEYDQIKRLLIVSP
jgi:hypothetical protein